VKPRRKLSKQESNSDRLDGGRGHLGLPHIISGGARRFQGLRDILRRSSKPTTSRIALPSRIRLRERNHNDGRVFGKIHKPG
jgi:hypothetical protein